MNSPTPATGAPARVLTLKDAIFLTVGIVVGAGIYKFPSVVLSQMRTSCAGVFRDSAAQKSSSMGAIPGHVRFNFLEI